MKYSVITAITVLASIKLAEGKTKADLLTAPGIFEKEFVSKEAGVVRRELVRKGDNEYIDIVQFRSMKNMEEVMEKEKTKSACHDLFAVMDLENMDDSQIAVYPSIATYS
jgi:hypothetical protein